MRKQKLYGVTWRYKWKLQRRIVNFFIKHIHTYTYARKDNLNLLSHFFTGVLILKRFPLVLQFKTYYWHLIRSTTYPQVKPPLGSESFNYLETVQAETRKLKTKSYLQVGPRKPVASGWGKRAHCSSGKGFLIRPSWWSDDKDDHDAQMIKMTMMIRW